jgi:hypothetical protein
MNADGIGRKEKRRHDGRITNGKIARTTRWKKGEKWSKRYKIKSDRMRIQGVIYSNCRKAYMRGGRI